MSERHKLTVESHVFVGSANDATPIENNSEEILRAVWANSQIVERWQIAASGTLTLPTNVMSSFEDCFFLFDSGAQFTLELLDSTDAIRLKAQFQSTDGNKGFFGFSHMRYLNHATTEAAKSVLISNLTATSFFIYKMRIGKR